ncbi:MAG: GNAT family N-acetyltransferase [Opitutales bacterium]|nr:GNAT family N-acetyltransferase [Opitutales bacterium]
MKNIRDNPLSVWRQQGPLARTALKHISRVDALEAWYEEWLREHSSSYGKHGPFLDFVLGKLKLDVTVHHRELLDAVPDSGPLFIVANHPLGGVEGMLIAQMLLKIRPDLKVLTNDLLKIFPEFHELFIGVDVLSPGKQIENGKGVRAVIKHVHKGGAVLIFPAGTVSTIEVPSMSVTDVNWNPMITRLAMRLQVPLLPMFVAGKNGNAFYLSAFIHKRLRTLLLPRAMIKKQGSRLDLYVGRMVPARDLAVFKDPETATGFLRLTCELLKDNKSIEEKSGANIDALCPDLDAALLRDHLSKQSTYRLIERGDFEVYAMPHDKMGPVMRQLAIERERTFRNVDEGTGLALDSDRFDPLYDHLLLWDRVKGRIAGGYRLGRVDQIVKQAGLAGVYSHSLFRYDQRFLDSIGAAIEAGRSFVASEYQRRPDALELLWKGIGSYTVRHRGYHTLFGCVSISPQYSRLASCLLRDSLLKYYGSEESLKKIVRARNPIELNQRPWTDKQLEGLYTIPVLNKLLGCVDSALKVPVLIRHYLALNGKFVSFTVNQDFNHSLDGLIVLDLRQMPKRHLKRYFGLEDSSYFSQPEPEHVA